ncbi:uncharacterized protein ALTATR162_LOCUS10904 [Alternaria atra]|uniref:N-alpha-acetyltransferase 40 n=1 Tax=Alternaria atra TaxID=119953 RepID=A0A8J2I6R6_9PLEO|nr:uncharacterized protein ALTATR162_LOCUS7847 [Alternaria atra]XP_043174479.1 uncharacterized protein ALTATR162_LOCUS10904 [Alternaria atra]CAG5174723.1 unnamed protein product [Alternaria atra]CAG5184088.1 unnamed protein product [Alternaria atra]
MDVCDGHSHSEAHQTPHVVARVQTVQALLREDIHLSAYEAPHLPCPVSFQFVPSAFDLKKGELEACLSLVEKTSGHDYKTSSIGWNPRKKREEMLDGEMMYLLVRQGPSDTAGQSSMEETQEMNNLHKGMEWTEARIDADSSPSVRGASYALGQHPPRLNPLDQLNQGYTPDSGEEEAATWNQTKASTALEKKESCSVKHSPDPQTSCGNYILGFTSFMFTYDDSPHEDREVLYIYEIHLHEQLRGQGLGSHLIKFVENVARACRIRKTMLTVFTANKRAKSMYEKLGYSKDECSPGDRVTRNKVIKADYVIMSKSID